MHVWRYNFLFRCDTKNIGLTMLCKFDGDVPLPAIWSHQVSNLRIKRKCFQINRSITTKCPDSRYSQVLEEYKKMYPEEELPDFLKCDYHFQKVHEWRISPEDVSEWRSFICSMQFKTINPFEYITFQSNKDNVSRPDTKNRIFVQGPCERQCYTQLPTLPKEGGLIWKWEPLLNASHFYII